jgi:hypothetical protein
MSSRCQNASSILPSNLSSYKLLCTVAQQSLYRFRIGLDADQERCKAVAQIMEAESQWVIIYQSAFVVPMR